MKTWNDYKTNVKTADAAACEDIEEAEEIAAIVSEMISARKALGFSQRDLATMCSIPQSSVARIESCQTVPNLKTLLKIFRKLNLTLAVLPASSAS